VHIQVVPLDGFDPLDDITPYEVPPAGRAASLTGGAHGARTGTELRA
jgi:hypothetical protein